MQDTIKYQGLRKQLIELLKDKGIIDTKVLEVMGSVPRHFFMDPGLINFAYEDNAYPIAADQTISQPYTVAYQSELLQLSKFDKVLEIGTIPVLLTSPIVGFSPTIEFNEEGESIDPEVSEPNETEDKLADIAAPLPELEPPDSKIFLPYGLRV